MYKVAKGGAITINSFLNETDRNIARDYIIKTASVNMKEAAKIGLQSLYADPKEVLEKYKEFDIVKEMQARKGAKLLWVRARAIDADVVNANGDLFSKEELLKEVEIKGEKIPVYKTFEGVPIYTNHKNDDIEQAKGMVVYAEWNEEENCVYCTFFVDEEAYPDIARNIRTGVIHDVSMGASVEWGVCSICNNKAYTEKDYCEHLRKYKGKIYPETGKRAYEKNYGVKFIELSCVGDGAFESCEIQEIYDVDDILSVATDLEKKASEVISSIVIAHQVSPQNPNERAAYENCLREAKSTANTAMRLAQVAGTLVGGPLLAGQGANQNSTVSAVLQALGIDPRSGLNVLDLINLSLNFLEVAVMNMFARKDNVDLGHVGKITKSMADLQGTMQDMIDDGIDVGAGQAQQPINQPQARPAEQPQPAQQAQVGLANYSPSESNIGKIMDFTNFASPENAVGGGVALASSNVNFVWASKDGKREVFASTNKSKNYFLNLAQDLLSFKENLNESSDSRTSIQNVIRMANERNKNIKTNKPLEARSTNQMDHFAKIASEQRKKLAAAVTIDFKVEDNAGNRVVLSTDGTITGYTNGKKTSWEPILNENQLSSLENGHGTRVAAELLKDYSSFVKTALLEVKERDGSRQEQLDEVRTGEGYDGQTRYDALKAHHKGVSNMTRGEEVATKHTGTDEVVREQLLADAGLYGHKAVHEEVTKSLSQLVSEVCKGAPTEILEKRLEKCRVGGDASAHEIVSATINALARTVVSARETPSYILKVAQMLSEDPKLPEMISAASTTGDMDAAKADKAGFFGEETEASSPVTTLLKQLGSEVKDQEISPIDITDALAALVEEGEITKQGIKKLVEPMLKSQSVSPEGMDAAAEPSKIEKLKSALMSAIDQDEKIVDKAALQAGVSAAAQSASEMQVTPDEIAGTIDEMEDRELVAAIDEAKTVTATEARLRARSRREFWGLKTASSKDIKSNLVGWLADYSLNYDISTVKIATAAKKLCAQGEIAEKLIERAISVKLKNEKTAAMNVTQSKMECLRFVCTKDDLGGMNPSDDAFEDAFKQKAIEVLQQHNFTVDPATFSFTDLVVDGEGNVTASVSTNVSKTFNVDSEGHADMADDVEEVPVVMSDSARVARKNKRDQVLSKYAMAPGMAAPAGAPGTAPQAPPAGPVGDLAAGANMAGGDLGVSGFTGNEMGEAPKLDGIPNPEEKKPWGSVCPVCGSDDVDVAEGRSSCNSCSSVFESEYIIKLISDGKADKKVDEAAPEAPLEGDTGLGAATASNSKIMIRLSGTIDSDVYLKTASPTFNKEAEKMLPIGMVCPSCGNRKAHKVKDNTFCYDCGNYSKTRVAASKTDPSKLDVSITWIE